MKHFRPSFALSLGLLMPLLAACSGSTADGTPDTAADGTATGASASEPVDTVASDVKSKKKKTCASVGGTCVGLAPSSCAVPGPTTRLRVLETNLITGIIETGSPTG